MRGRNIVMRSLLSPRLCSFEAPREARNRVGPPPRKGPAAYSKSLQIGLFSSTRGVGVVRAPLEARNQI